MGIDLVQRLSWYSTTDKEDFNGNLFDQDNGFQPTLMGTELCAIYVGHQCGARSIPDQRVCSPVRAACARRPGGSDNPCTDC